MPESQPSASEPKPNGSPASTRRKNSTREKLAEHFPSSVRQAKNPLARTQLLNRRGQIQQRLGITELDLQGVPTIDPVIKKMVGGIEEAVEILSADDSPDSLKFMAKWNSLGEDDQSKCHIEDVIIAAGLTTRRFIELLSGANFETAELVFKAIAHSKKTKVLKSVVKAATEETPIVDQEGNVVGSEAADVKAMELFFKLTGDIKPSAGVTVNSNSNNQTANITNVERTPLQTMDSWLLEIDDVRKPRQLNAPPIIPVEMPQGAPEIEYMPLGEE